MLYLLIASYIIFRAVLMWKNSLAPPKTAQIVPKQPNPLPNPPELLPTNPTGAIVWEIQYQLTDVKKTFTSRELGRMESVGTDATQH